MPATSFRDLAVWHKAMEVIPLLDKALESFPEPEEYLLASYLRRAAYCVPALIASGSAHSKRKEFARFISVALATNAEVECFLEIAVQVGRLTLDDAAPLLFVAADTAQMLTEMRDRLLATRL